MTRSQADAAAGDRDAGASFDGEDETEGAGDSGSSEEASGEGAEGDGSASADDEPSDGSGLSDDGFPDDEPSVEDSPDDGPSHDEPSDDGPSDDEPSDDDSSGDDPSDDGLPDDESVSGSPKVSDLPVISLAPPAVDVGSDGTAAFVAAGFSEIPSKKRRRALKVFGITVGVLAVVALVVYVAGAVVFMGRFLPNTKVGEHDLSLKTDAEVAVMLDGIAQDFQLDVIGGGFAYRTTGSGMGLAVDSGGIIATMHEDENPWEWPMLMLQPDHDETYRLHIEFKPSVYEGDVTAAIDRFNEGARPPVNATMVYDEKSEKFVVKPEEAGTQLDAKAVLDAMAEAIDRLDNKVVLGEDELIKPSVLSTDEKLIEAAELATGMVSAQLSLEMGGQPVGEVNGDTVSEFITIDDAFEVIFREEEMNAWVESLAANYNTIGTERTYTRADGKQVVVPAGGSYGWEIDTEALKNAVLEGIKSGESAQVEVPCVDTAAVYNGVGQRDWGNRYLDVDITEQHVRFYGEDGAIIWEDDFISGAPDGTHDTVPGTWYVNNKESPSKLIGYENGKKIYETTVTYWMPFEGNSIGFHDAPWQPGFGGSMYANGYGSHGCVNLSSGSARNLYDIIQIGDVVVVHY